MEMARRSKQKIVRKLPEQVFWGVERGGGGGEDRKMFLMSIQTLAMKKNADCSTSSFSRDQRKLFSGHRYKILSKYRFQ